MSNTSNTDRVQAEFLAALKKNGLSHTFQWMANWFDAVAEALVQDELQQALGEHVNDPQARGLQAMDMMMSLATSISNHSTSASANLMREARLAALAKIVESNYWGGDVGGYGSRSDRRKQWETWNAARKANDAAAAGQATGT